MAKAKIYALYHGEKNIMDGTLRQIAEARGIKYESLRFMVSPTYLRRKNNTRYGREHYELVEIGED